MLEVHPPEHPIHGVRDFFIHLLTITVGLLIALGLENLAEWRHHVHVRHEAEINMRHELENNRNELHEVTMAIPGEEQNLRNMLVFLQDRMAGKTVEVHSLKMGVMQATLQDASWNTASATGALSYMEYEEVERFSSAYTLQKKFDLLQDQALPSVVGIMAGVGVTDPTQMSPADAAIVIRDVRLTIAHLEAVRSFAKDVDRLYGEALKPR